MVGDSKLILLLFTLLLQFSFSTDCTKELPIKKNNVCELTYCSSEDFNTGTCIISNEIIKTQWLDNIVFFGKESSYLFHSTIDSNKNIFFITSIYFSQTLFKERQIFGLNKYGEFLFNSTGEKDLISKNNNNLRENNIIVSAKIENVSDSILVSCDMYLCEIIDYFNDNIQVMNFYDFISGYDSLTYEFPLFELNSKGNYLISTIFFEGDSDYYLGLFKFKLNYNKETNTIDKEIISQNDYSSFTVESTCSLSCFETENNIIECLYISTEEKISLAIFNNNLEPKEIFIFEEATKSDLGDYDYFLKGINLQKEIGIYIYLYNEEKPLRLLMKNLNYDENQNKYELIDLMDIDYELSIKEDKSLDIDSSYYEEFDLFKITNSKFCYIYNNIDGNLVIILFDLFGETLNNLFIRHYKILLKLYNLSVARNLRGFIFNDFIGIGFANDNLESKNTYYSLFMIFGYKIKTYIENTFYEINKNNSELFFIIKLNNYINDTISEINNNLFGYEFAGIKIASLSGLSLGIKYYINNYKEIKINDIININDEIKIDYSNDDTNISINDEYFIELEAIISEPDYEKIKDYTEKIENFGNLDYENYYVKRTLVTKTIKLIYTFSCFENCLTCKYVGFSSDNQKCLSCPKNYGYMVSINNCYDITSSSFNYYIDQNDNNTYFIPLGELCPNDYPFENTITKECLKTVTYEQLLNNTINPLKLSEPIKIIHDILYELLKNDTINVDTNDININSKDIIFQITKTDRQDPNKNDNISTILLNECEDLLKEKYKITGSLIIFKIDIKRSDTASSQVHYEVINPNNNEVLDLSVCKNVLVDIYSPVNLDSNSINLYKDLKEQGYDLYNSFDSFYNDICTPFDSSNNSDVLLKDRKIDYYNSDVSFCENDCEYQNINLNSLKVDCSCEIKSESYSNITDVEFQPNILIGNFFEFQKNTNLKVIKCYKLVFSLKGQKKNYGSFIIIACFLTFIVIAVLYFIIGYKKLIKVFEVMVNQYKKMKHKITDLKIKNNQIGISVEIEKKEDEKENKNNEMNQMSQRSDNFQSNEFQSTTRNNLLLKKNLKKLKLRLNKQEPVNEQKNIQKTIGSDQKNDTSNPPKNRLIVLNRMQSKNLNENKKFIHNLNLQNINIQEINNDLGSANSKRMILLETSPRKRRKKVNQKQSIKFTRNNNLLNIQEVDKNDENDVKIYPLNIDLKKKNHLKKRNRRMSCVDSIPNKNSNSTMKNLVKNTEINKKEKHKQNNHIKHNNTLSLEVKNDDEEEDNNYKNLDAIIKNLPKNERYKYLTDDELNELSYAYACEIDIRNYCQFYWSLIKKSNLVLLTFINYKDYNLFLLKLGLFLMCFSLYFCVNAIFFSDDSMHKIYKNYGKYQIIYQLPQTIYSSLLVKVMSFILRNLALSQNDIVKLKKVSSATRAKEIIVSTLECLKIKFAIFFAISFPFMVFFWYYLSAFCAVYRNTQLSLIKNTAVSFGLSTSYVFGFGLIPGFFRLISLNTKKDKEFLFKLGQFIKFILV